jgi:hypothetical protein
MHGPTGADLEERAAPAKLFGLGRVDELILLGGRVARGTDGGFGDGDKVLPCGSSGWLNA